GKNPDMTSNNTYVLTDAQGNIARWALAKQEDPFGNYIEYSYSKSQTTVGINNGNLVTGVEYHPEKITYTRHNSSDNGNYYVIDFQSGTSDARPDKIINARNGFLEITKKRLRKIEVKLHKNGEEVNIRSYHLMYGISSLRKSLISSVGEYDDNDHLFYKNNFEYYDEGGNANTPIISGSSEKWEGAKDNISSMLSDLVPMSNAVTTGGSLLGAGTSKGFS